MYEGRTRGKRMKYTYSDDEDFLSDSTMQRRSTRNTGAHTPAEPLGPVVTASGRHIRAPNRLNVETMSNGGFSTAASTQGDAVYDAVRDVDMVEDEAAVGPTGRPRRSAAVHHGLSGWASKKKKHHSSGEYDESEDDDEGSEPDFGDDEDEHVPEDEDEDEEEFENDDVDVEVDEDEMSVDHDRDLDGSPPSLLVTFPIKGTLDRKTGKYAKLAKLATTRDDTPLNSDMPQYHSGSPQDVSSSSPQSESTKGGRDSTPESTVRTAEEISVAVGPASLALVSPGPDPSELDKPKPGRPLTPPMAARSTRGCAGRIQGSAFGIQVKIMYTKD